LSIGIYTRLSVMMFLEFFIWGAWFVTMGSYLTGGLGFSDSENALAYATQSWGAIVAPFVIGLIADKYVNAERLLGAIHLLGAVLLYTLANVGEFGTFYPYLLLYMILYMPTLALVNAISFKQLDDPAKRFGFIRFWGTVGWIVAGLLISYGFDWDAQTNLLRHTFTMAAAASLALGVFSFTLPRTPPQGAGEGGLRAALGVDALALLRDRNFLVFFVASILICIPLAFYYQHANQFLTEIEVANAAGIQTLGQASEVGFMLLVPLFLRRFGMKTTLLIGMLAWAARYVLFAYGDAGGALFLLIVGIALHGVCYDFFFVSGQVFTDSKAGARYKSAAQGLITLATYGVGMLIGFSVAGQVTNAFVVAGAPGHDWRSIWLYPAAFAAVVAIAFALLFRNEAVSYRPGAAAARDG
jgi:nucleoside transporter